jgi:pseudouridine-5'-monophosphatase
MTVLPINPGETSIISFVAHDPLKVKLLEPFGVVFTPEVKAMMMGRKDLEAAEVMIEHYGLEGKLDAKDFVQDRSTILERLFPDCNLMPGVQRKKKYL